MKYLILTISLVSILLKTAFSQIVTTNPQYPTADQSVIITFNAASTALAGYTGDVYAHTGVNLTNGVNWQHVIGSWGVNASQPKLTKTGTNTYTLNITPTINSYYNVTASEKVKQMAFVFRSADASKQTADLFVDVYTNNLNISSPDSTQIYSPGDNVTLSAVALSADSIAVYVNHNFISGVNANNISQNFSASVSGRNSVTFKAYNSTDTIEDSTSFFVRNTNTIADLPSVNLQDGINYIDNNTVTLVLYAPFKQFVFVKGSFENWQPSLNYQMKQTTDAKRYWITLTGLTAAQEYGFQYIIDGQITVPDAYTDKILDPWNDHYISSVIYPNLMPYPAGKTSGVVSVFQTAQTPYSWKTQNFTRPDKQNLVIYETLIRDFTKKKDYQVMIDTIHYFKRLGINAIELMPICEFDGNDSWGYNPNFYFAPDKAYGTKNKLKEFIDTCHAEGIAVIMDIVLNHSYGLSPMVQMYYDNVNSRPSANNPWYNMTSPNPAYSWGYDFNHESPDTKRFVERALKYWLTDYRFDGFRFDFTKGFTNTAGDGWAYDQSRINILKTYADSLWKYSPGAYDILEHFTDNSEETVLANYGMMLWGNENYNYAQASMGYASDDDFSGISYKNIGWNNPNLVGYMESHDEERMMFRNEEFGQSSGTYNIRDTLIALSRAEQSSAFFFTVPGPKMIWQFEEMGYDTSINYPDRVGDKPVLWQYAQAANRQRLQNVFKEFIKLKKEQAVFQTADFSLNVSNRVKQIVLRSSDMNAVVIGNFDLMSQSARPSYPNGGPWYDYFTGQKIVQTDSSFVLQPGEYHLLTDKYMGTTSIQVAPIIRSITISGNKTIGDTLNAVYQFFDANGDAEGNSTYKWYRATTKNGDGLKEITGASTTKYICTADDKSKYLRMEITPKAVSAELPDGKACESDWYGPVTESTLETVVLPVPFHDKLIIKNTSAYDQLTIYNISGKIITQYQVNNKSQIEISIPQYEAGVYFVKLEGKDNVKVIKIIKK